MRAMPHAERLSSHLANQIEAQTRDPDWTLAHYTFVASVTTLASECDIAHSPAMSVASSHGVPRLNLAFIGESAELLANYTTFLIGQDSEIELLVDEAQRAVAEQAFKVLSEEAQWQMVFRGDSDVLDEGQATELVDNDLQAMQALAKSEQIELRFATRDPLQQGPAFGIWEGHRLVAMGVTNLRLPGVVQIGSVIAARAISERLHIAAIVSALVKAHAEQMKVFYIIAQQDETILELLETLGFVRERPMYRICCVLKEGV
ncbi:MAG: hypothetical protein JXR84_00635 [Anaerolineae bacterium]|nr:hypothetical protein [Anaerolineae bacterium]